MRAIGKMKLLKALTAVEDVVFDDFCEELELLNAEGKLDGQLKTAHEKLSLIYRIAHSWNPTHSCHEIHSDWRQESFRK